MPDLGLSLRGGGQQKKIEKRTLNPARQALSNQEHYVLEPRLRLVVENLGARSWLGIFGSWGMLGTTSGFSRTHTYLF